MPPLQRNTYLKGQLKVNTAEIQSQKFNVAQELEKLREKRLQKRDRPADDPVLESIMNSLGIGFERLMQLGGGVCHGLVYAWFASLNEMQTTLSFDSNAGGWTDRSRVIADRAGENQARYTARFIAQEGALGLKGAKSKASRKLAKDSGFKETEICYAVVSAKAIAAVAERVITDDYPRCYRISLKCRAGRHSLGLVRRGNQFFLLDPNVGIIFYDARNKFVEDLTSVLTATEVEKGYAASTIRVYSADAQAAPSAVEGGGDADDFDSLLAKLLAS
jgi:hypothetical protein